LFSPNSPSAFPGTKLKALDHSDFLIWKTIQNVQLSADGKITTYRLVPGEGDPILNIYNHDRIHLLVERAQVKHGL
jgi:hypothetical protein